MKNENGLRACEADGKKAWFHRWTEIREIVAPSPMMGGHPGGEIQSLFGVVEMEDGSVQLIQPHKIRFLQDGQTAETKTEEKTQPAAVPRPMPPRPPRKRSLKQMIRDGDSEIRISGPKRDIDAAMSVFDKDHLYQYRGEMNTGTGREFVFVRKDCRYERTPL